MGCNLLLCLPLVWHNNQGRGLLTKGGVGLLAAFPGFGVVRCGFAEVLFLLQDEAEQLICPHARPIVAQTSLYKG